MSRDEPIHPLLERPRLGILLGTRADGTAVGLPVWFDWDGEAVSCFAARDSHKVRRLQRDPRASLLVTNDVGEPEAWIAFDGRIRLHDEGGLDLALRLAERYWNADDPANAELLDTWRSAPEAFVRLVLHPDRIREGQ
jgi:PPOX class probable F420-dependent enzyme